MNTNTVTISLHITYPLIIQHTQKHSTTILAGQTLKRLFYFALFYLGLGERGELTQAQKGMSLHKLHE